MKKLTNVIKEILIVCRFFFYSMLIIFLIFIGLRWSLAGEHPRSQVDRISKMVFKESSIEKPRFMKMDNPIIHDTLPSIHVVIFEKRKYNSFYINKRLNAFPEGESWILVDTTGNYEIYLNLDTTSTTQDANDFGKLLNKK